MAYATVAITNNPDTQAFLFKFRSGLESGRSRTPTLTKYHSVRVRWHLSKLVFMGADITAYPCACGILYG